MHRIAESDCAFFATDVTVAWTVCPCVTFVHHAKAIGRNEMPFGRDTFVVPSHIVLDRGPGPPTERGDIGVGTPVKICIADCSQTVRDSGNGYYRQPIGI